MNRSFRDFEKDRAVFLYSLYSRKSQIIGIIEALERCKSRRAKRMCRQLKIDYSFIKKYTLSEDIFLLRKLHSLACVMVEAPLFNDSGRKFYKFLDFLFQRLFVRWVHERRS